MSNKPFPFSVCKDCCVSEGAAITIDDALSDTSTNPVQNKVVTASYWGIEDNIVFIIETEIPRLEKLIEQNTSVIGDIETALDNIIAIQNTLIGGESA